MPPLSAYTPFESLLFFQSLAALGKRPSSFISISDLLRNNKFVRENGASDAHRLSPEALEDLYTTLMRDGVESPGTLEPNGHHPESTSPSNPKKRKIASPRPDGLSDGGRSHAGFVPDLVSHLYARYKELVTKEIRSEEKRFKEIRDEIERLQKEEHEAPVQQSAQPAPTLIPPAKDEPAPEPMDVDTDEKPIEPARPSRPLKPAPIELEPSAKAKTTQPETQRKDQPQPSTKILPQPAPIQLQPPARPVVQQPEAQIKPQPQLPPQTQIQPPQQPIPAPPALQAQAQPQPPPPTPLKQAQSAAPNLPPQPQPPNGKALPPPPQPVLAPPPTTTPEKSPTVPSTVPLQPPAIPAAVAPTTGPGRPPVNTPLQPPQTVKQPVPSPTPSKPVPTAKTPAKTTAKKATAATSVSAAPPGAPKSSFQQWSLNEPQTPKQPSSIPVSEPVSRVKALQQPLAQQASKPDGKAQQVPPAAAAPSTPRPAPGVFQTPAPVVPHSGFATPVEPVRSVAPAGGRGPALSIQTPGSSTPWKKTPHLKLPHSPRSPVRPRPEDVSPISERAPSPFGSPEDTPEEPEPPRRRGPGRGRKKAADTEQGASKKKGEKQTASASKKRERSTGSSRSRGRSIISREDESGTESNRIKREVPGTPAGITDSTEAERSGKKAGTSETRPGRGRPKRKRAPSDVPDPEPPQPPPPEISQLSRVDPNQSTPYVVCARNFPRTGAPIMNDVTTHKHASIFAKPLAERDAPGYRDLIYRPQDLKSIKSAIHQGSRALAAATEAANTPVGDGESPAPNASTPSKNAVLMLQKTEDVIPPKAVVNSAQLEKELIRMFANAVMFNPVPQRGFGPAFPMMSDGGSGRRSYAPEVDEGGIINDTQEMFEDVEQAVTRWRAAERTADELASKSVLSLRRGSASDPNTDSADEVKG
ncbi:hypothetical protein ASPCAL00287 [Aspergillus calidoustus]|uniref:Bromo domain-containing protein n=1 Tax=Aspergillus calidoustus TaxID=454130 RepID=A0A0U5FMG3_ASPCI|nr:hypothetical protein ASPCAL00287 [Aspergillus calidoustus]